ncbi:MAG: hypothetical protein U1E60_14390 [Reyranellaceae bacterium]
MSASSEWPPLPTKGFISGRPAQVQDVKDGNAVFVAKVGDAVIGKPLAIVIPQFAFWTDSNGKKVPVVIIQAEEANGIHIFGFRDAAGADHAATGPEIELLGATPPN